MAHTQITDAAALDALADMLRDPQWGVGKTGGGEGVPREGRPSRTGAAYSTL